MKVYFICCLVLTLILAGSAGAVLDVGRLLLYWPCDEGNGDTLIDASGNGFDGTLTGGDWEDGQFGKAIRLQRTLAEVQGNVIGSTGKTGEITLACWFKMRQHSTYNGLISIEAPEGECCEYRLMVDPNRNPFWDAGHHVDKKLPDFTFELDRWYHYVMTADGDTGKIYVDGEFIGEQAENFPLPEFKEVTIYLGTGEKPGTWPVEDSTFDDVMIWDKALTGDEIAELMSGNILAVQSRGKLAISWGDLKLQ